MPYVLYVLVGPYVLFYFHQLNIIIIWLIASMARRLDEICTAFYIGNKKDVIKTRLTYEQELEINCQ